MPTPHLPLRAGHTHNDTTADTYATRLDAWLGSWLLGSPLPVPHTNAGPEVTVNVTSLVHEAHTAPAATRTYKHTGIRNQARMSTKATHQRYPV